MMGTEFQCEEVVGSSDTWWQDSVNVCQTMHVQ